MQDDGFNTHHTYSPMSFWFLNHDLDDKELRLQLLMMKEKGFRGVYIHPRDGLLVPYQSEAWWHKVDVILDECESLGMHAWFYDEDPFPSGAAGGKVFADHPEFIARELVMESSDTLGGNIRMFFPFGKLLKIVAIEIENGRYTRNWLYVTKYAGVIRRKWSKPNIHHNAYYPPYEDSGSPHWRCWTHSPEYVLDMELPSGQWRICAFFEREIRDSVWGGLPDLLNPEAVRYFMELTHFEMERRYHDRFGKLILGIFTDEAKVFGTVSWTSAFTCYFKNTFGYDISDSLPDLFFWVDADTAQVRHDYRLAIGKLFAASYVAQIANWCELREIIFTGHLSPEEDPFGQTRYIPYLLSMLKRFHLPGTDLIAGITGGRNFPLLHLGPKMASSAAHHMGRQGVIAEAFGANGWDFDFADMKRRADWLFVMGITDIVTHGQFYSIDGRRKKETPPSLFYQSSHWPYYGTFLKYMEDMSRLLREGIHQCRILVYYPQATFSAYYPDLKDDMGRLATCFGDFIQLLLGGQWDFDLADEETLCGMHVIDGKICGVSEKYDILLFAGCDYIESNVSEICTKWVSDGAQVWLVGEKSPLCLRSGVSTGHTGCCNCAAFYSRQLGFMDLAEMLNSFLQERWRLECAKADDRWLNESSDADFYMQVRQIDSGVRLFILNDSDEAKTMHLKGSFIEHSHRDKEFSFLPYSSLMLDITSNGNIIYPLGRERYLEMHVAAERVLYAEKRKKTHSLDISHGWHITPQSPNVLNLTIWHIWREYPRINQVPITATKWVNLMTDSVGIETGGDDVWAFARFFISGDTGETSLVYETSTFEGQVEIRVNGRIVPEPSKERVYDLNNLSSPITQLLATGSDREQLNWVEAHIGANSTMVEPLRLYGNFRVMQPCTEFESPILKYCDPKMDLHDLQEWDTLGYPHYAGTMRYEKKINIPEDFLDSEAEIYLFAQEVNDAGKLTVNGINAGTRYGHNACWTVTELLHKGSNSICMDVANSPASLLEGRRKRSGMLGEISLIKYSMNDND